LEANPENLNKAYLSELTRTGINRLSIGIQSFRDSDLTFMNRAHNSKQAISSINDAIEIGFKNISIDLIYGIPGMSDDNWIKNMETAASFPINHLSCYSLTVEKGTPLAKMIRKDQTKQPDEDTAAHQFELLMEIAPNFGFEHYEISNLCRDNQYALHNSSYWQNASYLGIGPSAHSFNGKSRRVNKSNNSQYIQAMKKGEVPFEEEILDFKARYNEKILTGLRTKWGIQKSVLDINGLTLNSEFLSQITSLIKQGLMTETRDAFLLTKKGFMFADRIASGLFL
jgi:oxygen-independent coproporphyrinogen-3 oxidase